jgi:hypothetical protein
MPPPWADGPRELLQHAVDHLAQGGDFDRRIADELQENMARLRKLLEIVKKLPNKPGAGDGK